MPVLLASRLLLADEAAKATSDVSRMTSQRVRDALVAEREKLLKKEADNELLQVRVTSLTIHRISAL